MALLRQAVLTSNGKFFRGYYGGIRTLRRWGPGWQVRQTDGGGKGEHASLKTDILGTRSAGEFHGDNEVRSKGGKRAGVISKRRDFT